MQKLIQVAPGKVKILKNVRTEVDKSGLVDLSKSIKENGLIQPITVRKRKNNTYELLTGQRRLLAARMAKMPTISAIEMEFDDKSIAILQTVENVDREDLSPLQTANAFVRMATEDCLTAKEISIKMNLPVKRIKTILGIQNLHPKIEAELKAGKIELDVALTFGKFSKETQGLALENNRWLLSREPKYIEETIIREYSGDLKSPGFNTEDETLSKLGKCSACSFSTKNSESLFDDKGIRCTNLTCYNAKRKVTIDKTIKELDTLKVEYYLIATERTESYNGKEVLSRDEYITAGKEEKKLPMVCGLVIDGSLFGKQVKIVLKKELKKIEKKEREKILKSGDEKQIKELDGKTPDMRYYQTIHKYGMERNAAIMRKWNNQVLTMKEFDQSLKTILYLFAIILDKADYRYKERMAEFMGLKAGHEIDHEKLIKKVTKYEDLVKLIINSFYDYKHDFRSDDDDDLGILNGFMKLITDEKILATIYKTEVTTEKKNIQELHDKFKERWNREPVNRE